MKNVIEGVGSFVTWKRDFSCSRPFPRKIAWIQGRTAFEANRVLKPSVSLKAGLCKSPTTANGRVPESREVISEIQSGFVAPL